MISRRLVICLLVLSSLAFGPAALADHAAAPVVTLLTPASGATVKLTSLAKDAPTFSWRVDYSAPPTQPVSFLLEVSTDPTFTASGFTATGGCEQTNLACFTSQRATTDWLLTADECLTTSRPPDCATRKPGAPITFYWRMSVAWAAGHPSASATGSFIGQPSPDRDRDGIIDLRDNCPTASNPNQRNSDGSKLGDACERDRTPPRLRLWPVSLRRGLWGRAKIHMGDSRSATIKIDATLYRGSHRLVHLHVRRMTIRFEDTYYYRLMVPLSSPTGAYRVCVRVTDRSRNSARRCAPVRVR